MVHQVTSKDGVLFWVESAARSVAYDRAYAARHTAAELAQQGDFSQIKSLDQLLAPEEYSVAPVPATPAQRRASFTVIKGGKS